MPPIHQLTEEEQLVAFILAASSVSALTGARVFPQVLPDQPTYPCIVYQRISGPPDITLGDERASEVRYQLSAFSKIYAEARAVATALHKLFEGYHGALAVGEATVDCFVADDHDGGFDPIALAHRADVDVLITFPET